MAEEKAAAGALGNMPEALKGRSRTITLSDGSTIRVEKWSWMKFDALWVKVGDIKASLQIAEESVPQDQRDRVKDLPAEDVLEICNAAVDLNCSEKTRKNVQGLLGAGKTLMEAVNKGTQ